MDMGDDSEVKAAADAVEEQTEGQHLTIEKEYSVDWLINWPMLFFQPLADPIK